MVGHFSILLRHIKNGQKLDSFSAYLKQHINSTTACTYLCKYMTFKVVKQLNLIGAMKQFTKPSCNLCTEERLTILKNIRGKHVMVMNKNL